MNDITDRIAKLRKIDSLSFGGAIEEGATCRWLNETADLLTAEIEQYRKCLQWYADGNHMGFSPECDWENVSGEPPNWLQNNRSEDYEMIEDGGVARKVLAGEKIDWSELDEETETTNDTAQLPAKSDVLIQIDGELMSAHEAWTRNRTAILDALGLSDNGTSIATCVKCGGEFERGEPAVIRESENGERLLHQRCAFNQAADKGTNT